jgi:UDP-GlcNAc3NAcA epimerase
MNSIEGLRMPYTCAIVIGSRPQLIKAAPILHAFKKHPECTCITIDSGQHYDHTLFGVHFEALEIPKPTYQLGIGSGSHGEQTGRMLAALESVLISCAPDIVIVFGDTNTTVAAALATKKLKIPLAHVESGLRSYDRTMPEEINRIVTDHISDILFAPTNSAYEILTQEGLTSRNCSVVGDCMYDATLLFGSTSACNIIGTLGLTQRNYILLTLHRAALTDNIQQLKKALSTLSEVALKTPVVFPLHPRTRHTIEHHDLTSLLKNIHTIPPLEYTEMLELEKHASLIVTDSGGVQKEAYYCGVPCIVLRRETEWRELVSLGAAKLIDPASSYSAEDIAPFPVTTEKGAYPFGDGTAAIKIVVRIIEALKRAT